jgi:hypothetical protein
MKTFLVFLCAIASIAGMTRVASAIPVTHTYTEVVTEVDPVLSGTFGIGDIMTITYTFESTTADTNPHPQAGFYPDAITSYTVQVGTYTASAASGNIFIHDDFAGDSYEAATLGLSGPLVNDRPVASAFVNLRDPGGPGPITDDALPIAQYNPDDFAFSFLSLNFFSGEGDDVVSVFAVIPRALPEPHSIALLAIVLAGVGIGRRRSSVPARTTAMHRSN